ncbi:MAG: GHKL domain-containing protein [Fuerstiella sp.]|nr:GHKL domain-containing protein [Fuerstiella sp.]
MPVPCGITPGENDPSSMSTPACAVRTDIGKALRQCAFKATDALTSVSPARLNTIVRRLLGSQARAIDAIDIHLYRARLDDVGTGIVGLRYHSGQSADDDDLTALRHFQFQLLSSEVQKCLRDDQIAQVLSGTPGGGRLITGLMKQLNCASYLLCPLFVAGRLRGIMGVAVRDGDEFLHDDAFFQLLKLNGSILLHNVLRVRRQRKRSRSLRQWRRIADQACDFAFSVDDRFVICNTTAFGTGEATPNLDGLRLTDVVVRSFHRELKRQVRTAIQSGEVRTSDFQLALDQCEPHWFMARIEPMRRNAVARATLYMTDNHSDMLLQEQVHDLTDRLGKVSRLSVLGQMSTEFSHQLNQPLQAILNYCNIVQRRFQKGTATAVNCRDALASIEESVVHSADIIQRIREFVNFRSLHLQAVPVDEVLQQAIMLVLPTIRGRDADLIPAPDSSGVTVMVDRAQTTHVLVNLIVNALDACCELGSTRPRIELLVESAPQQGLVTVSVRDNGPGLPAGEPEIVFRKFYSSKPEGLGLGLSISREVCESQGGSLRVKDNDAQNGCTFYLTAPVYMATENETTELRALDDIKLQAD